MSTPPQEGTESQEGPATERPAPSQAAGSGSEGGPRSLDGVSSFIGLRWDDPQTVRVLIRPELINRGGLLSGVATYAMVDYCMGSTLWAQTTRQERIATISISINYIQTATEGEIVCRSELDRRNRSVGIMKSTVHAEDGRLLVTAIGSYAIFPRRP
jgi:acyl-coenzyme A thioesterase PaaI-like protein